MTTDRAQDAQQAAGLRRREPRVAGRGHGPVETRREPVALRWFGRPGLADAAGSVTILTAGVLVVILMVIGVGASITGVHLERNALQYAADSAALAAAQSVVPDEVYGNNDASPVTVASARRAADQHLGTYPLDTTRSEDIHVSAVQVDDDGTVRVVLRARTHPPLAGWFTRKTGISVPLAVEGEARAR